MLHPTEIDWALKRLDLLALAKSGQGKEIRQAAGLTLNRLGEIMGDDKSRRYAKQISRWERRVQDPIGDTAIAYGQALEALRIQVASNA